MGRGLTSSPLYALFSYDKLLEMKVCTCKRVTLYHVPKYRKYPVTDRYNNAGIFISVNEERTYIAMYWQLILQTRCTQYAGL
jgi:hypothetical protein